MEESRTAVQLFLRELFNIFAVLEILWWLRGTTAKELCWRACARTCFVRWQIKLLDDVARARGNFFHTPNRTCT